VVLSSVLELRLHLANMKQIFSFTLYSKGGCDRVIGTVIRYGLDGPEMESRLRARGGGEISHIRPDRPWAPLCVLCNGYQVPFPGILNVKRRGVASTTYPIQH
jgi:hypothetical protein